MEKHTKKRVKVLTREEEIEMNKNTIFFEDYGDPYKDYSREELAEIYSQIMDDIENGVRRR